MSGLVVLQGPDELEQVIREGMPDGVQFIVAVKDTAANLATLGDYINDRMVQILGLGGVVDDPLVVAVTWARHRTINEARDPGWGPTFYELSSLRVSPDVAEWFSAAEVEQLLNHGVTPVYPKVRWNLVRDERDVRVVVPRSITSYHIDEEGAPDCRCLDTCTLNGHPPWTFRLGDER